MMAFNLGTRRRPVVRRVPICLFCSIDIMQINMLAWGRDHHLRPDWRRTRCQNCKRPVRVFEGSAPVCCEDCGRLARNQYDKLRRRVRHEPTKLSADARL